MNARWGISMLRGVVGAVVVAVLVAPAAVAKGGPGGGGEEAVAHSLSVPAAFVGANPFGLTCDGTAVAPTGEPQTGFAVPGYYYVQGVNAWRAGCVQGLDAAQVAVEWGDNLGGDAKLKVGAPIRVEVGLFDTVERGLTGWDVIKLEPSMLDRLSPYGTLAEADGEGGFVSQPQIFGETRVWASGATLRIWKDGAATPLVSTAASAEINATGRVVYGYNLRVPSAGDYWIEYTFPGVTISGTDIGSYAGDTATLMITVQTQGGGGRR